ncbi:PaaI family thioesterase [Amycolatopsis stemonae]
MSVVRGAESWETRIGVPESFVPGGYGDARALPGGAAYGPLMTEMRGFLDDLAGAVPDPDLAAELAADLAKWRARLPAVPEREQAFGHRMDLPGRGQVMAPAFTMTSRGPGSVEGTVRFGRFFLGGNGAVHGGAVALLFDEVLGRLSDTSGRSPARTASLTVNFRSITPVDEDLVVRAWFAEEAGRKRHIAGEIRRGDVLCADATGLFIRLNAGQS